MAVQYNKILIIRLSAMGDVINTLPTLTALRRALPKSYIGWAVEDRAAGLLKGHPDINDIFVFNRAKKSALPEFIRRLRRARFDVAIDLQGNLKSGLVGALSGARERVGFSNDISRECNWFFTNRKISLPSRPDGLNRTQRGLLFLKSLGLTVRDDRIEYDILIPPEDQLWAYNFLKANRPPDQDIRAGRTNKLTVIHPGTSKFGAYKRWAPDKYAQLADRLIAQTDGNVDVLLSWGPGERLLVESIAALMKHKPLIITKLISLAQSAAIFSRANLFIGSDSGPLYLANALGRPLIALFGPKDPAVYSPYPPRADAVVVRKDIPCSPCRKRTCSKPDCMNLITADEVFEQTKKMLAI
ncbi:MAG: glycosyltransferase family 9 protein [Planctomycetes bacterium]|nr:glycosyltransferase family 9 protein [Planctomycetota bacterium]